MIKITSDQLSSKLESLHKQQKSPRYALLVGGDTYLQHTALTTLRADLQQQGFSEFYRYQLDAHTDWLAIYDHCQSLSLFNDASLLYLYSGENGLNAQLTNKLNELAEQLNESIALIIALPKLTKAQENAPWLQQLSQQLIWVSCLTPDQQHLPQWLANQARSRQLQLEPQSLELLCYYYEGNLLALAQVLEQLQILYPSGQINHNQLQNHIQDAAIFSPYHWLDAILLHKPKRAMHILQQLHLNGLEALILLRTIQRELILLINLYKADNLATAFNQYKVWQNRRALYSQYLKQTDLNNLYQALQLLTEMEITLKQESAATIWQQLEQLTLRLSTPSTR